MELTALQRATLSRLVEGSVTPQTAPRSALRGLRRYGLVDADHQVTDEGRDYLAWLGQRQNRQMHHADARRRRIATDPAAQMRASIRRWADGHGD